MGLIPIVFNLEKTDNDPFSKKIDLYTNKDRASLVSKITDKNGVAANINTDVNINNNNTKINITLASCCLPMESPP